MTNISASQYGKLFTVALFWGATWVAGRIAVGEVSPLAVASWRFLLAATVLGTLLVKKEGWPRWSRQDLIGIFVLEDDARVALVVTRGNSDRNDS